MAAAKSLVKSLRGAVVAHRVGPQCVQGGTDAARAEGARVAGRLRVLTLHMLVHGALVSAAVRTRGAGKGAVRVAADLAPYGVIGIWENRLYFHVGTGTPTSEGRLTSSN